METQDQAVIWSSDEANWRTPPTLFKRLDDEFYLDIDLAASSSDHLCDFWVGPDHPDSAFRDALTLPWHQWHTSTLYLNPPYSRKLLREIGNPAYDIAEWAKTCATQAKLGATIVGLFPYGVQTRWWYEWVRHGEFKAREIRTIPHRVSYLRPDGSPAGNAGGNSCVIIWQPPCGYVGDWQPAERVWDYR